MHHATVPTSHHDPLHHPTPCGHRNLIPCTAAPPTDSVLQVKATEAYEVPEEAIKSVAEAVKDSDIVQLDAEGTRVKRKEVGTCTYMHMMA